MEGITITPVRASVLSAPWPSWRVLSSHNGLLMGYVQATPVDQADIADMSAGALRSGSVEFRYRARRHSSDATKRPTIGDFNTFDDALASIAAR